MNTNEIRRLANKLIAEHHGDLYETYANVCNRSIGAVLDGETLAIKCYSTICGLCQGFRLDSHIETCYTDKRRSCPLNRLRLSAQDLFFLFGICWALLRRRNFPKPNSLHNFCGIISVYQLIAFQCYNPL